MEEENFNKLNTLLNHSDLQNVINGLELFLTLVEAAETKAFYWDKICEVQAALGDKGVFRYSMADTKYPAWLRKAPQNPYKN